MNGNRCFAMSEYSQKPERDFRPEGVR